MLWCGEEEDCGCGPKTTYAVIYGHQMPMKALKRYDL
jgi:hypothetical protein